MKWIKDKGKFREVGIIGLVLVLTVSVIIVTYTVFIPRISRITDTDLIDAQSMVGMANEPAPMLTYSGPDTIDNNPVEESIDDKIIGEQREILSSLPSAYSTIVMDFEKLKAGDSDTVIKYFGESEIFTPEMVADRVYGTAINFISQEVQEGGETTSVIIHICTIDYPSMNADFISAEATQLDAYKTAKDSNQLGDKTEEDYKEAAKKEVTRNLIDGKYKVCYNIPVTVNNTDSTTVVSENFKQAITGSWYTGPGNSQLTPVECLLDTSNNSDGTKTETESN